jgi:hypothetical protein
MHSKPFLQIKRKSRSRTQLVHFFVITRLANEYRNKLCTFDAILIAVTVKNQELIQRPIKDKQPSASVSNLSSQHSSALLPALFEMQRGLLQSIDLGKTLACR